MRAWRWHHATTIPGRVVSRLQHCGAMRSWLWLAAVGCAPAATVPPARFANAPPVHAVNDRVDTPAEPERHVSLRHFDFYDAAFAQPIVRALELPRDRRAIGVNAIDEVPDSTWFTNRIGIRDLTPGEIERGPLTIDSPERHLPWTVHSTKPSAGAASGVMITDARGIRFMLKFDEPAWPELLTATDVVSNRLIWACGFNVAEDQIVEFTPADLVVAPDATVPDPLGETKHKLTRAELDRQLAALPRAADGRLRAMATRWLAGKSLGGPRDHGTRDGDPNDVIPHELRRDLRGERAIFAWLDHDDTRRDNFLDMWVADPADPHHHHVRHYQIDFDKTLGAMPTTTRDPRVGHRRSLDLPDMLASLAMLGLRPHPWGTDTAPPYRGVAARFGAWDFDPGGWRSDLQYLPLQLADRFDAFWGAKLVGRFTRDQIRAAVSAGRYSDPRAVDYVTDTLVARQRALTRYWYARVNPLDRFAAIEDAAGVAVCFDDLAIGAAHASAAETSYLITRHDRAGRPIAPAVRVAATAARTCTPGAPLAGYTIFELVTDRPGVAGATYVHVARDPAGAPRVIGLWRT